jgi:signal transduction histidine kinase
LLNEKGFRVETSPLAPSRLPLAIVSQVFQNLITNAIRYAGDQDAPLLRIGQETIDQKPSWVIEDNGPGIPPHLQRDLFEKAAQSNKGQGIGLVQVREILNKFNAQIEAKNSPLGGAHFIINF